MPDHAFASAPMLTTAEVARRLRIKVPTVQKLIRDGHLNASKIGRDYRVEDADLKAFIDARKGIRHKARSPKTGV